VSSHDRRRRVASPAASLLVGSVVKPAGVGPVGHGRPGVLELGGAFGLTTASGIRDVNFSPSVGWFRRGDPAS
jgi:hypothetical protein